MIRLVVVALVALLLAAAVLSIPNPVESSYPTTVTVQSGGPMNLAVTSVSSTGITLSWSAVAGASQYQIERSENVSSPFMLIANVAATTFTDNTVTNLHAYLYRVRPVLSGCQSEPGNVALGTAISFEFSQLQGQQIKAQHLHDVRTAINAVRAVANIPAASWTRPTLNGLVVQAQDVQELRNRLSEALSALNVTVDPYQDPILSTGASGTTVRAIHIEQLQTRSTRGIRNGPTVPAFTSDKREVGEFEPLIQLPLVPVHLSVLPDGRVLFWGRDKGIGSDGTVKEVEGRSEAYVWNITDGSNKDDLAVFRPSDNTWHIRKSSTGATTVIPWGVSGDVPAPGDYDGDGRADVAIFRPSDGLWGIVNSSNGAILAINFADPGDVPTPGDYDGDGKTDIAIYRPSDGLWGVRYSDDGAVDEIEWGISGGIPVPGDYDRDRKTDLAVFRPSEGNWYIRKSSTLAVVVKSWGLSGDTVVPGDYNGDGATDLAVYRSSDGNWYVKNIIAVPESTQTINMGQFPSGVAVPGDYDGDTRTDAAIFVSSQGTWRIRKSSNPTVVETPSWGTNGDLPVPKDYDGMLRVANQTTNLFCSGHTFSPDGRLLVTGGNKNPEKQGGFGEPHTNIYDFRTNKWVRGPDMNAGRWYPYNVTLNTGETLVLSGITTPGQTNNVPQVYGSCLRNLNSPTDLEFSTYPYVHLRPDGKVLVIQSGENDRRSKLLSPFAIPNPNPQNLPGIWESFPSTNHDHWTGSSVLFDSGKKVLVVGGFDAGQNPTSNAEYIELTACGSAWKSLPSMNFPRTYHTTTILPDGKVLVTGGVRCQGPIDVSCGAVLNAEMWDPTSDPTALTQTPWRTMAAQTDNRAYHSIAALLPDGKVLVGGGGLPGAEGEFDLNGLQINNVFSDHARMFGHRSVEIYSPPYLFDSFGNEADRPTITSAPESILYGQTFSVGVTDAGPAPKVSLVRLASVTHGFNQDQRHLFLNVSSSGATGMTVSGPVDSNQCPPGHYMLFVLNNGVPSIAKIVRVGNTSIFPTDVPATTAGAQGFTWEQGVEFSSSVNGQITHIRFWKDPGETGIHTGRIWSAGMQLASAVFSCETASGWQEVALATPLQITAGVKYRVTFNLRDVGAKSFNVLDSPITRGPLTAWGSWFAKPAGTYPTTFSGSNLFADIVFKTGQ